MALPTGSIAIHHIRAQAITKEMDMTTKPLWVQLCEMTSEERRAELEKDIQRKNSGALSNVEVNERIAAWERVSQARRLANAAGYAPEQGVPFFPWLIERGLIKTVEDNYIFWSFPRLTQCATNMKRKPRTGVGAVE